MIHAKNTIYSRPRDAQAPHLTDMNRADFMTLVQKIYRQLPHPLGRAALTTFKEMIMVTNKADWVTEGSEPCCFMSQTRLAEIHGHSPSRIRAHEDELIKAGLIEKRCAGNGSRAGYNGTGIYFNSGIERIEEFRQIKDQIDEEAKKAARLRGLRSTHKKHLKSALAELGDLLGADDPDVQRLTDDLASWPRADRLHSLNITILAAHELAADTACRDALNILSQLSNNHGQPHENERSYIQTTNPNPESVYCNASVSQMTSDKSDDTNLCKDTPSGVSRKEKEKCDAEIEAHKSEFLQKLTPLRLYHLASPEMQMYLQARQDQLNRLTAHDFAHVAQSRLYELGIHPSAWVSAVKAMGEDVATMCVLILDANRDRPGLAVQNPGGYLRGMTRAAQSGKLNIIGSLIGLSERSKDAG